MLEQLVQQDIQALIFLNNLGSEAWDGLWKVLTRQTNWIPYFAFLLYLVVRQFGWRQTAWIILCISFMILICDQSTNLFKNTIMRLRPCSDPDVLLHIRAVITRSSYSFISGHSSNSMAVTVFLFALLRTKYKYIGLIFFWPLIFAYSRIYLGVHYPLDIVCGFAWGILIATIMLKVYHKGRNLPYFNSPKSAI